MTLFRQLIVAVLTLFLILYGINIFISLNNSRVLVEEQMNVHAQDTATSLALSMTRAVADSDIVALDAQFDTVFDSGYFQRIYFINPKGSIQIDRSFSSTIEAVPSWFVKLIQLPISEGKASVVSGSLQLGELRVISHPGQSYLRLWQIVVTQLLWFGLVTFVTCLTAYSALRWLLTPLHRVELQAEAISEGNFELQNIVPKTRELESVVEAMNRMSVKLKKLFADQLDLITRLRRQSTRDPVTGLPNRADFDARLESFIGMEIGPHSGMLMIVAVSDLTKINQLGGRSAGNNILKDLADRFYIILEDYPKSVIARRQGTEFSLFIPDVDERQSSNLAQRVFDGIASITWQHQDKSPLVFYMGYVQQGKIDAVNELLCAADMSLKKAQMSAKNTLQSYAELDSGEVPVLSKSVIDWQGFIDQSIANESVVLHYQPVWLLSDSTVTANEVYARFPSGDDLLSAGSILPMAERLGLMPALDKIIVQRLATIFNEEESKPLLRVNLSSYSFGEEQFLAWFETLLANHPFFAKNLVIEVAEYAVRTNKQAVVSLNHILQKHQAKLCIDHFGLETSSFSYLGSLKLHSLKVHRSFTKDLESNSDNQFYIQALTKLAHNMDLQLFVEGVETASQRDILSQLNVDACQGNYLGKASEVPVSS